VLILYLWCTLITNCGRSPLILRHYKTPHAEPSSPPVLTQSPRSSVDTWCYALFVYRPLPSLVPNVEDLLALDVEEVAEVLLVHLISSEGASQTTGVVQLGRVNRYNFFSTLHHQSGYSSRQDEVARVLMEAWSWLESEGFLVPNVGTTPDDFFFSRRAQLVKSREDFDAYRKESLLPRGKLHERITAKV
jgi:hypothetical protein